MCHHGRRSLRAASILRNAGFTDVVSMAGGIDLWSIDIDPAVARY
jgi:rhodanese-related sulfurtransferase